MINFTIKPELETLEIESDGITWSSYTNWDGHRQLLHDSLSINETPWNDEMAIILREIKNRLKSEKKKEITQLNESLKSFGDNDLGKSYYPCRIDKRLIIEMKSRGVVITRFINEAIAEKLTKEE
jgi:hypothetical protein